MRACRTSPARSPATTPSSSLRASRTRAASSPPELHALIDGNGANDRASPTPATAGGAILAVAARRRAGRDRVLRRARHLLRDRMDARARRGPVRVHRRPRPVRRAGHRRGAVARAALRRRGRRARRLQGHARRRGACGAPVRRVPHPDRGAPLLQHDTARAGRHGNAARARDGRARRRHLGRRVDVQGQRHRALLPLRPARQRAPAHLQAVARRRVRRRARRPERDERVARGARPRPRHVDRPRLLDRREPARRDARGEEPRVPRHVDAHRHADHGRRALGPIRRDRAGGGDPRVRRGRAGRDRRRRSSAPSSSCARRTSSAAATGSACRTRSRTG